jgi:hypothetical protein
MSNPNDAIGLTFVKTPQPGGSRPASRALPATISTGRTQAQARGA